MNKVTFFAKANDLLKEKTLFNGISQNSKIIYYIICNINSNFFSFFTGILVAVPVNILTTIVSTKISNVNTAIGLSLAIFFSFIVTINLISFTVTSIEIQDEFHKDSPLEKRLNITFNLYINNEKKILRLVYSAMSFGFLTFTCLIFSFLSINDLICWSY